MLELLSLRVTGSGLSAYTSYTASHCIQARTYVWVYFTDGRMNEWIVWMDGLCVRVWPEERPKGEGMYPCRAGRNSPHQNGTLDTKRSIVYGEESLFVCRPWLRSVYSAVSIYNGAYKDQTRARYRRNY